MRPKRLILALALAVAASSAWAQMADRPIVTRRRSFSGNIASQARLTVAPLQSRSPVTLQRLVSRMRISTSATVHQSPVLPVALYSQSEVNVVKLASFAPWSDITLVSRRHFDEPIVSYSQVNAQRIVDQFPAYDEVAE